MSGGFWFSRNRPAFEPTISRHLIPRANIWTRLQNDAALAHLRGCLEGATRSCHPNTYIVIVGSWLGNRETHASGDSVWIQSTVRMLLPRATF